MLHVKYPKRNNCSEAVVPLPVVHVNLHSAGLYCRVEVLLQRLYSQNVSTFLSWHLYHELRPKHGLLSDLLPRVFEFLIHPAAHCEMEKKSDGEDFQMILYNLLVFLFRSRFKR